MEVARAKGSPWLEHEAVVPGGILPLSAVDRPRPRAPRRPLTILGLASTTLANHAAVLVVDGEVVAAVQEERIRRRKQLGWHPLGEPGVTVVSDATLTLEESWPKRAIAEVLDIAGLTMADVDHRAYNGIPARFFPTYALRDAARPPRTIFDGRDFFIPHHLTHAASAQQALEETVLALVKDGVDGRPVPRLCLAGGVALNCSMNQRLRQAFSVEEIYVQPAANDAGTALGAAAEAHFELTGENLAPMTHAKLGRGYSDAEVTRALERFGLSYTTPEDLSERVAQMLVDQKVVAWFDGRLEFGPRALGGRSILADPRTREMRDRVNAHKARQSWRPFGPSILAGHEADWFMTPFHSPFMLFTLPVRPERRGQIAAVVHVDGTTRPQSVSAEDNPNYHALIAAFYRRTGVPMVLNTSFNTAFEPIVQSPEDAISSFLQLGVDALVIEGHLVERAAR